MNKSKKRVWLVLMIIVMIAIFFFSSQLGDQTVILIWALIKAFRKEPQVR